MKQKLFCSLLVVAGALLMSATNGFSYGSYGTDVNTICGSTVYTGSCTTCHVADKAADAPGKTAYLVGGTAVTDFFCPAPPPVTTTYLSAYVDRETAGVADFDGDGNVDVLVRNKTNGKWFMNLMSGDTMLSCNSVQLPQWLTLGLAGIADFDGDGNADVLLRNATNGKWFLKQMAGATVLASTELAMSTSLDMEVAGIADFDNDGNKDVLLRNTVTGKYWLNLIANGTVITKSRI